MSSTNETPLTTIGAKFMQKCSARVIPLHNYDPMTTQPETLFSKVGK